MGGFLQGLLTSSQVDSTHFPEGTIMSMDARYATGRHQDAVCALGELLVNHPGISKADDTGRWLLFHSELKPDDAITSCVKYDYRVQGGVGGSRRRSAAGGLCRWAEHNLDGPTGSFVA